MRYRRAHSLANLRALSIMIDRDLVTALDRLATTQQRSRSDLIDAALKAFLKAYEAHELQKMTVQGQM